MSKHFGHPVSTDGYCWACEEWIDAPLRIRQLEEVINLLEDVLGPASDDILAAAWNYVRGETTSLLSTAPQEGEP